MVILAAVIVLGIQHYQAGEIPSGKTAWLVYAGVFVSLFVFYKLLACLLAGRTPGTEWMGLRLLHFDGREPGTRLLLLRLMSSLLSAAPAGAGLLWALADEERLTWHDHMSRTFVSTR